ncbi:MAG: dockerin type I repeat-containing protein, partial [Clostridia bacterium]|nr:dockerin type I repeat-containing protein [Clostridia bacterium]
DAGYEVVFNLNKDFKPAEAKNLLFDLQATTGFDVQLKVTTSVGDWDYGLVADFWPGLCVSLDNGYLPAETYSGICDLYSCYEWNQNLPSNGISTIKQVKIIVSGQGTVTLNSLQVSNTGDVVRYADGEYKTESSNGTIVPDPSDKIVGDVNDDGNLSTVDARALLMLVLNNTTVPEAMRPVADYNGDGNVTTTDARAILLAVLS